MAVKILCPQIQQVKIIKEISLEILKQPIEKKDNKTAVQWKVKRKLFRKQSQKYLRNE